MPPQTTSLTLALAVALAAVPAGSTASAAEAEAAPFGRALHWRLLEVDARLDARGDLHVRERHVMVFSGDWNGGERTFDVRRHQSLRLQRVVRVDAAGEHELRQGGLDAVDRWSWAPGGENRLRWRSRLPSDPPFRETELTYDLHYVLTGALVAEWGGGFRLAHDFAFADRPGVIERVRARLALDPEWSAGSSPLALERSSLPPGKGAVLTVPLSWTREVGAPEVGGLAARTFPSAVRLPLALALAIALVLAALRVVSHGRRRGLFDPGPSPSAIDEAFLRTHVFAHSPAVIGAAWDGELGSPEVSAELARMAAEGKLETRVERGRLGFSRELRLRLLVARDRLEGSERSLVDGLFFEGDETDSRRLREHYRATGFDPTERLVGVSEAAEALVPRDEGKGCRPLLLILGFLVAMIAGVWSLIAGDEPLLTLVPAIAGVPLTLLAIFAAVSFSSAVTGLASRAVAVAAPLVGWGGIVIWHASAASARIASAHVLAWVVGLVVVSSLARTRLTAQGVAARRRLAAARRYLADELRRPRPRIEDAWIPWLLALGLGSGMDRWVRVYGPSMPDLARMSRLGGGSSTGGSPGWTGLGGQSSGAGASGTWAALGAFAAGVSRPSSSSGSGSSGGGSSGGGGGGGW